MKIFDVFLFFNELDLLEIRLNLLYPFVDYFVINEATKTFSGLDKPLYYLENKDRFEKFQDKIIHNVVPLPTNQELDELGKYYNTPVRCHQNDAFQKNIIVDHLNTVCDSEDIIIWSDLDEIPNPDAIEGLNEFYSPGKVYNFAQEYCMCYLNYIERSGVFEGMTPDFDYEDYPRWIGTKIFDFSFLEKYTLSDMKRKLPGEENFRLYPGGWHWTYVGSDGETVEDRVATKLVSAAHQEHNNDYVKKSIIDRLNSNQDPLGRGQGRYETVEVDDSYPDFILENKEYYSYLIKDVNN